MYTQLQRSDVMSYFIDLISPNSQDLTTNKSHIYICIAYQTARCLDVLKLLSVWLLGIGLEWGRTEMIFSESDGFSVGSCGKFVTSVSKRLTKDSLFSGLACTMSDHASQSNQCSNGRSLRGICVKLVGTSTCLFYIPCIKRVLHQTLQ